MDLTEFVFERLREDQAFALYRAAMPGGGTTCLVATPTPGKSEAAFYARLEHELALADLLDEAWSARPLALARHEGRLALVLEDPGGKPLDALIGRPFDLAQFLSIAVSLAAALRQVHDHGLIHKDIRPANILVDGSMVRLTGFGFASRMPRERPSLAPPKGIAGTLAYMAPEQTGRMNRSIDTRSDLYALGVTLYEMLVGVLPFSASDPMEWIYCHIARVPPPPSVRVEGIPQPIDAMLLKLLAKNAEDRYQTAAGIEHDLERCRTALREHGVIEQFPLAERDVPHQLLIPEKLYGREADIATLTDAFNRVATRGDFDMLLVSGDSGVGKSSMVKELRARLHTSRALFASGKFDQYKRDIPYATLAQAFEGLLRQILSQDDATLYRWRTSLSEALGGAAQLIVDLVPELGLIIGDQPPAPIVSSDDERTRFHAVFRQFIGVFARPAHPLVLFLDDLQWLDSATLDLLERLCVEDEVPYFFLIGAYRSNEADSAQVPVQMLERIRTARSALKEIRLSALTPQNVGALVADALHADPVSSASLAQLVYQKAQGNPFFTVQFLTSLNIDGLLDFDCDAGAWRWDIDGIRNKGITDNVAALVASRLVRYRGAELAVIKQLACLGNGSSAAILSRALGVSEDAVEAALHDLVGADLVRRQGHGYAFAHDRVQEAAYALIPEQERSAMHLRAGRLLSEGLDRKALEDAIFEIVSQFNRGVALITLPNERQRLAELNLLAGKRAKAATAYRSALIYLSAGRALLPTDSWTTQYRTTFDLEFHHADCEFMAGDVDFAEERLVLLSEHCANLSDLALAVGRQIVLYTWLGRIDRAQILAIDCLARMGVTLPANPTDQDVEQEYCRLLDGIGDRVIDDFIDLPVMTDSHWRDVMDLLVELLGPARVLNPNLLDLVLIRMANISLAHGNCDASCHAYANMGGRILGWRFGNVDAARCFGRLALRLIEERGFDRYASRVYSIISGIVAPWTTPLRQCSEIAFRVIDRSRERGGIIYPGFAWASGLTALLASGKNLKDVHRIAQAGLLFAKQAKYSVVIEVINTQLILIRSLRGDGIEAAPFASADVPQADYERYLAATPHLWHAKLRYRIRKLQFLVHFGHYEECLEIVGAIDREFGPPPVLGRSPVFEIVEYCFFSGLARAATLADAGLATDNSEFAALVASHDQLMAWAEGCPDNFLDRATLLAAEIARLEGRDLDAQRSYEEAVRLASIYGAVQNEGLANELASRFYAQREFGVIAEAYLRNAHACYVRWGADGKARQLERFHPYLGTGLSRRIEGSAVTDTPFQHRDLAAVVEMYQALSREILLDQLIERLMITVVEHAGAVRGLLLLPRGEAMRVVAEAASDDQSVTVDLGPLVRVTRDLPQSIVNYVIHAHEVVIVDDALVANPYASDEYLIRACPRSVLCVPLLNQNRLVGVLYLENNLASHIFTPDRLSVLQLLASQAAISIENAELFRHVQETQDQARRVGEELRRSFDMIPALAWRASPDGLLEFANKQWHDFTGVSRDEAQGLSWIRSFHPADAEKVADKWRHLLEFRTSGEFEARMCRVDGEVRRFLVRATPMQDSQGNIVNWHGTHTDIENLKRAEQAQEALARVSRITALGELTVSIAHEVSQPLMAVVTNAATCLRWLADDQLNVAEARVAAERIIRHGHRAGDVIASIRALARKAAPEAAELDLRDVILEVLLLTRNKLDCNAITVETDLAADTGTVLGDRVQMQQVILNLIINGIEAIGASYNQPRLLRICSARANTGFVQITVSDTGVGLPTADDDQIFDVFFTTKEDGIGIGLSICRSIVEAHRGRLWASRNQPHGTAFHFTVPAYRAEDAQ